jgi:hypothetical protein
VRRRADREGRRRATVPQRYSNTGTVHAGTVHAGGLRGKAARVWGAVESPGSLREAGNN